MLKRSACNDDESPYLSDFPKPFINKIHSIGVVVLFIGSVYFVWGIGATVEYFKYLEAMRNGT